VDSFSLTEVLKKERFLVMAKLSIDQKPRRARVSEEVRAIRTRYAEAQRMGYSNEEAARLAQGKDPISPVGGGVTVSAPVPAQVKAESQPPGGDAPTQTVSLSGGAQPQAEPVNIDIPPTWQDLPWPQLKVLAESLNGGRDVKSRKLAGEIIEQALAAQQQ
jgi:hypothetical protein